VVAGTAVPALLTDNDRSFPDFESQSLGEQIEGLRQPSSFLSVRRISICPKNRGALPSWRIYRKNECKRRGARCHFDPANEVLASHREVPIDRHEGSDMASAEKLLGAAAAVSRFG
jgi:hypothetical protein